MSKKSEAVQAAQVAFNQSDLDALSTTSAKIRFLNAQGLSRGAIAKALNIRYQWVRNVLITPLKKQG